MKLVKEHINEKFTIDGDPIRDMGIGKKALIVQDLNKIGISANDVEFFDDYSFFMKEGRRVEPDSFYAVQQKHFPEEKAKLLKSIKETKKSITDIIDEAVADGIEKDEILFIIKYMLSHAQFNDKRHHTALEDVQRAQIYITKIGRSRKQKAEEDQNNIYVFIGFMDKAPVYVNGKKYYEDKFKVESMVKFDKYDYSHLTSIPMMKIRANTQYQGNAKVYMLTIPKYIMDEDRYSEIPEQYYDLVVKYKQQI